MINEHNAYAYCCEDISKIENYDKAIADKTQYWHCHHRKGSDENMSVEYLKNHGLYYHRPAKELIFLTNSEHQIIHGKSAKTYHNKNKRKRLEREQLVRELLQANTPISKILSILNSMDDSN